MINYDIVKLILISFIAIKSSRANKTPAQPQTKDAFLFENHNNAKKQVYFDQKDSDKFLKTKPTGLNFVVLDLDFPEEQLNGHKGITNQVKYRVVQCLLNGHVSDLQRNVYKNIAVKLVSREPYNTSADHKCSNEVVLTLSPPGKISSDHLLTNHFKLYERRVVINKNDTKVLEIDDVLNQGFVNMELFWLNFEIKGSCSKYITVELLKPNNSNEWGDQSPPEPAASSSGSQDGGSSGGSSPAPKKK